jgi:hypothetical protein
MDPKAMTALMNDYYSELGDIPIRALALGIRALLNDDREWYQFPSIGNIRGYANQFIETGMLPADQAWRACLEGRAPADSLAFQVFENLGFDRFDIARMDFTQTSIRQSNFIKTYHESVSRMRAQASLPVALRKALPKPELLSIEQKDTPEENGDVLSPEDAKIRLRSLYSELDKQQKIKEEQSALLEEDVGLRKAFLKRQAARLLNEETGEPHGS